MLSTLRERMPGLFPRARRGRAAVPRPGGGPAGAREVLGLGGRALYWSGVIGVSVAGGVLSWRLGQTRGPGWRWTIWALYVVALAGLVHGLNTALFDAWAGWARFGYLLGIIAVTFAVVQGVIALVHHTREAPKDTTGAVDPQTLFLRRIPIEKRGELMRLEAQDHYLNVVTENGQALILMRLQDAIDALEGARGLRVHRSHWVMVPAVRTHHRDKGRDFLELRNGDTVPVSRSFRADAQAAGLI